MTYVSLAVGYSVAAAVLMAAASSDEMSWPKCSPQPGVPLRVVAVVVLAVVAIGQLFQRGLLVPAVGDWRVLGRAVNQLLIFAPVFVVASWFLIRRPNDSRRVLLLPSKGVARRLGVGIVASFAALIGHQLTAGRIGILDETAAALARVENVPHAIQILGEDIGIALLLASLLWHVAPRTAIVATGLLFALAHIPAMANGLVDSSDFARLIADGVLAAGGVALLFRIRDVWAIWPVHVAMDLTQFLRA